MCRVKRNTTGDPAFSMYNLSLRSDWADSAEQFCHRYDSHSLTLHPATTKGGVKKKHIFYPLLVDKGGGP